MAFDILKLILFNLDTFGHGRRTSLWLTILTIAETSLKVVHFQRSEKMSRTISLELITF